jgi:hypothetical protein
MSRYAIRIIGPSGMTTYLGLGGVEVPADEAYAYRAADTAWAAGASYKRRFANQNFTYDVVNLDDPEDRCAP